MAAEIGLEGHVEHLHKNLAHVVTHPLLENIHQEVAVLFATDRALRYQVAGLRVEQALAAGLLAPSLVRDIDRLFAGTLDDRDKLQPLRAHLVAKKTVNRAAVFFVGGVDRAQYVELDAVLAQQAPSL